MASSASSSHSQKSIDRGFSGIEPPGMRRKVSESTTLYDVFINHRGPDSKQTLALPLYQSLEELGIRAFLDKEEMELGQSFPSAIQTAINSALVHIAIFSKGYAESPWCLAELLLMQQTEAKITPVFYGVEPWELRYIEKGAYADAFIQYKSKSRYLEKLDDWKEALRSISFTTGHEIKDFNVSDCKRIVTAVQKEVQRTKPLHVAEYPVALDKLVHDFERRCLDKLVQDFEIRRGSNEGQGKAEIVGIFGMGGVGKTTLCKELFNRNRKKYDRACFLFDVREASARSKLPSLQEQLLRDLFGVKVPSFQSREEGSSSIFDHIERSSHSSFLLVLDDINHLEQLEAFMIMEMLKKPGNSLVIISTRDVGVLKRARIEVCYHLKGMDKVDSRVLFSLHAFSQPQPATGYEDLVDAFLHVCGGLPLSLKVLGRHVNNQDLNCWRIALDKYGETLHVDIKKILKISFDALQAEEKQIFIDIACFFVGQSKHTAIRIWKASGWKAEYGLKALQHKCLVEEIDDLVPVLRMHDHLRDLGREMANELSQPRRLWHPQDLKELESKGFEDIFAQTKGRCFHSIFDKSLNFEVQFFLGESDDNAEMSSCLLWLHLLYPYYSNLNHLRYPHQLSFSVQPKIPSWIPLQNMQCLRISNGCFKRLWEQDEEAPTEMKQLEICGTRLEEYPDLLGISTHVEKELKNEPNEVQRKSKMKSLMVKTCRRLSGTLTMNSASKSIFKAPLNGSQNSATVKAPLSLLENLVISEQENIERIVLNGNYCPNLQSLELYSIRNLIEVQFRGVETLNYLNISKCGYLKILSDTSNLKELEELSISACPMLEVPNLDHLSRLKKIRIAACNMNSVPAMPSSNMLVELNVSRCPNIHELCIEHLSWLEKLIVHHCDGLESLTGLSHLLKLVEVSISWCWILQLDLCLVGLNCLKSITSDRSVKVKRFELNDCKDLETVSGISFEMVQVLKICGCPELKNFTVICGRRCLELVMVGCGKLNYLTLTDFASLNGVFAKFHLDLYGLSISDCPMLKELPSFGKLIYIEEIRILQCGSLQNMTLPMTLKRLELNSCGELETMVGISCLIKLAELNIKSCPKLRLELNLSSLNHLKRITIVECLSVYNITLPTTLIELTVQRCMQLQIKGGIGHLTKLTELHISECPVIEEMPVFRGLSCLESITVDGCSKFSYFQVIDCAILKAVRGNLDMGHLALLCISDCPELEQLPCLERLACLVEICIFNCRKLQKVTLPRTLKNLQLESCKELKSVSEISSLKNLVALFICECEQLELDLHLEHMDSLQRIRLDGCRKLKSFLLRNCQNLERVMGNFDTEWISICGCHELEELFIRDLPGLSFLKKINIESCDKLQNITLPAKLTNLTVQRCRHLRRIAGLDDLSKLRELDITQCPEIELLLLAELSCLERITINSSEKLHKIILPTSVLKITVQCCKNLQMVAGIGNLSMLTELYIRECPVLEDLPILFGINSLESIRIDGCGKLKLADCGISEGVSCSFDMGHLVQLWISDCPGLEELACFASLTSLERISIIRSTKLQKITLPITLKNLHLDSCKELKHVSKMGDLSKLSELCISECPLIEESSILSVLSCLKMIVIDSCDKLRRISLPTTLIKLTVRRCRELKMVAGSGNLTDMCISECPLIEEFSILSGLSCLKMIVIDSCDKLQRISLPTTLINLTVRRCRELKMVSGSGNLTELTDMCIDECPLIEELPILAGQRALKMIVIDSCDKLRSITLPTALHKLRVRSRRELSILCRLGCLQNVVIEPCERQKNIAVIEELRASEAVLFRYCSNAAIQDCIPKLKDLPSTFIQLLGRVADGAKSNLNPCLLSEAYLRHEDIWRSPSEIIILCAMIEVSSSSPVHTINKSSKDSTGKFKLPEGESIITTIINHQNYGRLNWQYDILSKLGIMKKWCVWGVTKGEDWRICHALTAIIDKLHKK
ncbi:hypothetical protein SUGI_0695320 [Cryptomeria japonica]|nr:hypothetical protein SUGI_0695320 [Cryptomeria japonica]